MDSAILELFEFIKLEDIRPLCSHVVEIYGKVLEDVEYVQTFKTLKTRYDQHQDRQREREKGKRSICVYLCNEIYRFVENLRATSKRYTATTKLFMQDKKKRVSLTL